MTSNAGGMSNMAFESFMENFTRSNSELCIPGDILTSVIEPSATRDDISPFYISASTCLRNYQDTDGYDLICFCTRCQDEFLSQACHSNSLQIGPPIPSASLAVYDQLPTSTETCIENQAMITLPSLEGDLAHIPTKKVHKSPNIAGISKSVTVTQKDRPEALLKQLEEALSENGNFSVYFKWKASVHFQELKKLFENEATSQSLPANQENSSLSSDSQSRGRKVQQRQTSKEQRAEKIFLCTLSSCSYATNSAMDWRRHEETHWPQRRYMCLKCPVDSENPQCSFCMVSLSACDIPSHYLQCSSARRNNRTFARKDKLTYHLQKDHSVPQKLAKSQAMIWNFPIDSGWLKQCIFCFILFDNWEDRIQHLIEKHFKLTADHKISRSSGIKLTEEERARGVTVSYYNPFCDALSTENFDSAFTHEPPADDKTWRGGLSSSQAKQFQGFKYNRHNVANQAAEALEITSNADEKVIKIEAKVDIEGECENMQSDGDRCSDSKSRTPALLRTASAIDTDLSSAMANLRFGVDRSR